MWVWKITDFHKSLGNAHIIDNEDYKTLRDIYIYIVFCYFFIVATQVGKETEYVKTKWKVCCSFG